MASDWNEDILSNIAEVIDSRHKTPVYSDSGYPMVRVVDVNGGALNLENTKRVSDEVYEDFSRGRDPEVGDLVISRVGSYGVVSYVNSDEKFCLGQNTAFIIPKINSRFLYYQLISPFVKWQIEQFVVGAVQKTISLKSIRQFQIKLPPEPEQKAIAHILGSLDDKIELNRQMNETLEAMAQALFKSWFVDFDPVIDNALAAGNVIPDEIFKRAEQRKGLEKKDNSDIQSLFPDEFEFTEEMGWIPKGWASDTVKELANVTDYVANGSFASLKENVTLSDDPEYALYIRTTDYKNDFSLAKAKYVNKQSYDFLKKSILEGYEVIISNVGDTGTVFRPPVWLNQPMTLGSNAIAIKNEDMSNFLQYYFSSYFGQYQISSIVGGSAQPKFNKTDFRALAVYFGSLELVSKFEEACQPLRAKIDTNLSQILLLSNIRDTLLPKLMSGEIRISDAEALVENV